MFKLHWTNNWLIFKKITITFREIDDMHEYIQLYDEIMANN